MILTEKFIDIMRTKADRVHLRVSPGIKKVWLDLCRIFDDGSQSEIFETIIMVIAKHMIDNGRFTLPKKKEEDGK